MARSSPENPVVIYGPDGQQVRTPRRRTTALAGGNGHWGGPPYDAADVYGQHMASWQPWLASPDAELNMYRDRIVSRVRDMVRNDGWASGAVTRILDNAIGANLRPVSKPDYKLLAATTGKKGFDDVWAREYGEVIDANFRAWAYDDARWVDITRNSLWGQIQRIAFRHKLVDGDALAIMQWRPDNVGYGRARYATCIQLIDPDRLSNPQMQFDQHYMRGGVKINDDGAAVAYYIRRAHVTDWFQARDAMTWDLVPRETSWGRPIVVHDFDGDRASTHRGGAGIFAPVLQRLKMLVKYDGVELDAAIINAIFGAYLESPFDHELIAEAVSDGSRLNFYQGMRREFHDDNALSLHNSRIPTLFPGEKINTVASERPTSNFQAFESAVLRNVAAGVGLSAQQVSNDWSDVNYSSARAALLEAWKTLQRRRDEFASHFSGVTRTAWLEESFELDDIPLPAGAPEFIECRTAYARCDWMGPGRGWIDPVAEKQGSIMGMDAALSTLELECAEQGLDYREVLAQRKHELGLFDKYNIPRPEWAGENVKLRDGDGGKKDGPAGQTPPKKPTEPPPKAEAPSVNVTLEAPARGVDLAELATVVSAAAAAHAPPVVNVTAHVGAAGDRYGVEKMKVTKHDDKGRVLEWERRVVGNGDNSDG